MTKNYNARGHKVTNSLSSKGNAQESVVSIFGYDNVLEAYDDLIAMRENHPQSKGWHEIDSRIFFIKDENGKEKCKAAATFELVEKS